MPLEIALSERRAYSVRRMAHPLARNVDLSAGTDDVPRRAA